MIEYKQVTVRAYTGKGYEKLIYENRDISYRLNGMYHREDRPAFIRSDGYQFWYINDKCHREDGPAIIYASGEKEYWLNGVEVTPKNHHKFSPLQLVKLGLI